MSHSLNAQQPETKSSDLRLLVLWPQDHPLPFSAVNTSQARLPSAIFVFLWTCDSLLCVVFLFACLLFVCFSVRRWLRFHRSRLYISFHYRISSELLLLLLQTCLWFAGSESQPFLSLPQPVSPSFTSQ